MRQQLLRTLRPCYETCASSRSVARRSSCRAHSARSKAGNHIMPYGEWPYTSCGRFRAPGGQQNQSVTKPLNCRGRHGLLLHVVRCVDVCLEWLVIIAARLAFPTLVVLRVSAEGHTIYMGKDKFENEDLIRHGFLEDIWYADCVY